MPRALWLLVGLQCRGWFRLAGRNLRTVRGALLALIGLIVLVLWLASLLLTPRDGTSVDPVNLRRYGPAVLLSYCVMMVLFSRGERAIYFSPAEVQFLFAGPFSRRQLLVYKVLVSVLIGVPTTLFLAVLLHPHARWFVAAYLGLFLTFLFLQLFTMAINLVAITAGTRAYTRGRKVLLGVLALAAVVLLFQASQAAGPGGFGALMDWLQKQRAWQAIAAPLRCFAETFLVEKGDWLALARWGVLAAGIDCLLIVVVLALDAHYLESAAAVSERIYTQIQRMRRGEGAGLSLWGSKGTARWSLPGPAWWGGIGPIAWRQMITATRNLGRLALLALVLAPVMIASVIGAEHMQREQTAVMMISSVLFWLTVILSTLVPFDFRGDLDRMDVLKTLPIRPWRLAVGQLLTPVLLVSTVQCLILGVVMIAWEEWHPWLVAGIAFTLPFNFLLFGLDNLLFLWFPSRLVASNPGDFQALGRNVLFLLVKLVFLGVTGGIAVGLAFVMFVLTEKVAAALAVGWSIASLFAAALVPMLALAFHSFDVSRDTPA